MLVFARVTVLARVLAFVASQSLWPPFWVFPRDAQRERNKEGAMEEEAPPI